MDAERAMRQAVRCPPAALALGWAGVIPFAALAVAAHLAGRGHALLAIQLLIAYGAIILAFMGGAQWGLEMARAPAAGGWAGYGASVLPALLGAAAYVLSPRPALVLLMAGFAGLLAYDLWRVRSGLAPGWYGGLRRQLSLAVMLALAVATLAGGI